jgi:beta-glucosidase/6-phospho-beta-glucosidase/beta-galactosidase
VACDSYHKYKRDVEMLVELGVDFYRFSISWSRILPKGFSNEVNQDGIDYYNNLIDEMLKYNIKPMITLFHWDTPQVLQEMGGWTNPLIIDYFEDYARIAFENFGDRVKDWITFNEPYNMCLFGYGSRNGFVVFAPDLNIHGIAEYECTHNVIKAHAKTYHLYKDKFKPTQHGKLGMANVILWAEPETNTTEAEQIAEKSLQFNVNTLIMALSN